MQHRTTPPLCAVQARVLSCTPVCREHVAVEFVLPQFPSSEPGQFVQLLCRAPRADATAERDWPEGGFPRLSSEFDASAPFLRRPFSIADRWDEPGGMTHLEVLSRTVGPGTAWLARLRPQDALDVTGPLGRGFALPADPTPLVLVGGGVGIPPLLYLARRLKAVDWNDVTVIAGARTRTLLPLTLTAEPAPDGEPTPCFEYPGGARYPTAILSDDGSIGRRGWVTDGLAAWQARHRPRRALVLACGPEPMLKAVATLTRQLGLDCQLCIERNMGCGLGTCLSCVVRARDAQHADGWRWALSCQDGPVFARDELLDYSPAAGA